MLKVSVNSGSQQRVSSAQCFISDFDGKHFVTGSSDPEAVRWLHYGEDYSKAMQ